MYASFLKSAGFLIILACWSGMATARQIDSSKRTDSTPGFLRKVKQVGIDETTRSIEKYKAGRIAIRQEQLLQEIKHTTQRARILLERGIDSVALMKDLEAARANLITVQDGILTNQGTGQTNRNLEVSSSILDELLLKMTGQRKDLSEKISTLVGYRDRIDSLSADSALYIFPADSTGIVSYLKKLAVIAKEIGPTDTALTKSIIYLQQLQTEVDLQSYEVRLQWEQMERLRSELTGKIFQKEFPYLWQAPVAHRPLSEIVKLSIAKEKLALEFYFRDYSNRVLVLIGLILVSWIFLRSLKQRLQEEGSLEQDLRKQLVVRDPMLSAIVIVVSLFQFIFPGPPFIFSFLLWIISAICLGFLFRGYIPPFWMRFWITMVIFSILAGMNNLTLQASRLERWLMLFLSLAGLAYTIYILRSKNRTELREKGILYFISFTALFQVGAIAFNILGRYNLAKTLLVSGFTGLVIAILFLWTVRLINQGLSLISGVYKHPDRKLFYINFDRIGEKVPTIFYLFLVLGWFILVGRNFYVFEQVASPFREFLNAERTVGNYTFTINSLFIFLLILAIALVLSQVISFFAGDSIHPANKDGKSRKPTLGSWLLLIRIFIITLGLFFAFAAAGIPLDRLTIILGALGVGIGLGLQGLVSNLVSGLIIAFEKPVNVGDIIEVNGKLGTMKSIGFRSSVVSLVDGACQVIPNSDLLSNHLVNWTMARNIRRLSITVGVAYGSDLKKVKSVLEKVLTKDERVLIYPEPLTVAKDFGASAIDFEVLFWVRHIKESLPLKGEIITQIHAAFKEEGIHIPFPQQELRILTEGPQVPGPFSPDQPAKE